MNTETRMLSDHDRFRVHYGFVNGFFQITGCVETLMQGTWVRCSTGLFRKAIARLFPHLTHLLRWHRTLENGSPSGYLTSSMFWYHDYRNQDQPYGPEYAPRRFREAIVCGVVEGDEDAVLDFYLKGAAPPHVKGWLMDRLPRVKEAFRHDIDRVGL